MRDELPVWMFVLVVVGVLVAVGWGLARVKGWL